MVGTSPQDSGLPNIGGGWVGGWVGGILTGNNATSWLHLASWNFSAKSKIEPSVAI